MPMRSIRTATLSIPAAAFLLAAAHIAFEYFNGGVKTHHVLASAEFPGFSNWLGLIVLPALGFILAFRVQSLKDAALLNGVSGANFRASSLLGAIAGALVYGALLALAFHFGFQRITEVQFLGLFLMAIVLPVYRIEYIFGFVVGMTLVFGSVIPLVIALVISFFSIVVRRSALFLWAALRKKRR
jgi:hypothetical protein